MSTDTDLGLPRQHRWLGRPNHSHYVPAWYEPHANQNLEVRHLGVGQGFPIHKVMQYRRWALDAEGNTLDQKEFEDLYLRYLGGFKTTATHDPRNESVPYVLAFVRMKYDRVGSLVDMDFEDDGAITKTEKYTQEGEIAPEYLLKNQEKSDKLAKIEMLADLAKEGVLTPNQFQSKAAEIIGASVAIDEFNETGDADMIAAPPRGRGRPKGSKNKPKPIDYAANP